MIKSRQIIINGRQAKRIDVKAKVQFGVSTLILMENAGRSIAEEAIKALGRKKAVVIFCGKGNNGADGLVAARHLLACGIVPRIFLVGRIHDIESEARINLGILLKLKQNIVEVNRRNLKAISRELKRCNLIIDALLGIGLKGKVRGIFKDLIELINLSKRYVLSVDLPSGLDATSGEVLGCCVKADKTVTFVAKKRGMILGNGLRYCGRVVVKNLGIPLKIKLTYPLPNKKNSY